MISISCQYTNAGGDDGRLTGWSSANASRGRSSGFPFISGSLSKQKSPIADEVSSVCTVKNRSSNRKGILKYIWRVFGLAKISIYKSEWVEKLADQTPRNLHLLLLTPNWCTLMLFWCKGYTIPKINSDIRKKKLLAKEYCYSSMIILCVLVCYVSICKIYIYC